ncbi:MAG: glycosyltransferase family 4 protein [Solirubrobacterales bacterium]
MHDLIHLSDEDSLAGAKRNYYERVVRPAIRRAGAVMTVSEHSKSRILDWLGDGETNVVVVGNGCSSAFRPPAEGMTKSSGRFLYVGSAKPHKNFRVLASALRAGGDLLLTCVGPDATELAKIANEFEVSDQVEFKSGVSDIELAELYRSSMGVALPSLEEGFGFPALEALSCGTPVAYYHSCTSVAEIVGSSGISVDDPDDGDAWRRALEGLSALSADGPIVMPDAWSEKYNWDAVASRIDGEISTALERGRSA